MKRTAEAMAEITVSEDAEADLAIFVIYGVISADEMLAVPQDSPSFSKARHLVDMTKADFHLLDSSGLSKIAEAFAERGRIRPDARTAVLVSSDVNATIVKLYTEITSGMTGSETAFKVTSSRDDALAWLSEADA